MFNKIKTYVGNVLVNKQTLYKRKKYFRNNQSILKLQPKNFFIKYIYFFSARLVKPIKSQELFLFSRQISRLLQAGIPLLQILILLEMTTTNRVFKKYLQKIIRDLENGFSLSQALQEKPAYFSKFHCSLIQLGEKTATLGLMFDRIAVHQEKNIKLKAKIIHALVYPVVVLVVTVLVFIALLVGVVPQFEQFFLDSGAELPLLTRIVIYLSKHIGFISINCGLFLLISGSIFLFLKKRYQSIDHKFDCYILKIPVASKVLSKIIIARITRALSTALAAELPLIDALQLIAEISGNFVYKSAILLSCNYIRNGEGFYQAFSQHKLFPLDLLQLIKIGEISNCLSEMLNNIADISEEKVNYFVDNLSVVLEPVLIIVLALMVACLVIAMYLPLFKLGSVV